MQSILGPWPYLKNVLDVVSFGSETRVTTNKQTRCLLHVEHLIKVNKLENWHNVYCLHLWATCFNLYTGHLQALLYM
jgi:hypothetical protein